MALSRLIRTTDALRNPIVGEVYQATFIQERLNFFINTWISAERIEVQNTRINNKPSLKLVAFKGGASGSLDADFPCPDHCMPANQDHNIEAINVNFDPQHIFHMSGFPNTVLVNFRLAVVNGTANDAPNAFAVYVGTVESGVLTFKNTATDTFYISDPT